MTRKETLEFGKKVVQKVFFTKVNSSVIKGWIARDNNNLLYLFEEKPTKSNSIWFVKGSVVKFGIELPKELFPEITCETEPKEVEISINLI